MQKTKKHSLSSHALRLLGVLVKVGLLGGFVLSFCIVLSQVVYLAVNKSYMSFVFAVVVVLILLVLTKIISPPIKVVLIFLMAAIGLAVCSYIIFVLKTPLVVEPLYSFEYAKHWLQSGPSVTPHALIFSHWGIFGLLLLVAFKFFGSKVALVKLLGLVAIALPSVLFSILLEIKGKKSLVSPLIFILALYPTYILYSNFPGTDSLIIGLISCAVLLLFLIQRSAQTKVLILEVLVLALVLALSNLFKQTAIILVPIFIIIVLRKLIVENKLKLFLPVIGAFFIVFMLVPLPIYALLGFYARGPVNKSILAYTLATGLNPRGDGLITYNYYYPYYERLSKEALEGTLTDGSYKREDARFISLLEENIAKQQGYPKLFLDKFNMMWSNDDPINNMSLYSKEFYTLPKLPPFLDQDVVKNLSKAFFLAISFLYSMNILRMLKERDESADNVFIVFFTTLMALVLLLVESQPRYRVIVIPLVAYGAVGGLGYLEYWGSLIFNKSRNRINQFRRGING